MGEWYVYWEAEDGAGTLKTFSTPEAAEAAAKDAAAVLLDALDGKASEDWQQAAEAIEWGRREVRGRGKIRASDQVGFEHPTQGWMYLIEGLDIVEVSSG